MLFSILFLHLYYRPHFSCALQFVHVLHPPNSSTVPFRQTGQVSPTSDPIVTEVERRSLIVSSKTTCDFGFSFLCLCVSSKLFSSAFSGKKLNQEIIGPDFIRTIIDCGYRIALERYIFEVSSEQKSEDVLQLFVDGIADWEAKEPGVKKHMVIAFGLFSMPPGGINKLPNVDYHVWMDQQMNVVANHPVMADMAGLNWWTSILADEETVRFVGKLYRHYAIEGKTAMLTRDPLFLTHIRNADFEKGLEGWTLQPAEEGTIQAKSFPRYGRIEGRYMGLGRPADPEHIGDTFLWMKRSEKGPNTFSQTIKDLEPGRLYSMKMFSCDYKDLIHPEEEDAGRGEQVHREGGAGGRRPRCEAVVHGDVRLEPGAAHPGLDHLSLEGLPSEGADREADRFGLAGRGGSRGPVRPGADVQLPGNPTLSRMIPGGRALSALEGGGINACASVRRHRS